MKTVISMLLLLTLSFPALAQNQNGQGGNNNNQGTFGALPALSWALASFLCF